jgi:aldose sugar dehydrogenase
MKKFRVSQITSLVARSSVLLRLPGARKRVYIGACALLAGLAVLIFSSPDFKVEGQDAGPTVLPRDLTVRPVVTGLTTPSSVAFLDTNDMLALEKNTGRVQRVVNGVIEGSALDLAVNFASERGLLGIALHPHFADNRFVYLFWTWRGSGEGPNGLLGPDTDNLADVFLAGNRVDRFVWDGATLTFDRNLLLLRSFQADAGQPLRGNHNGGVIRFGPDGKLYVYFGDQGRRGWLQNNLMGPVPDDQFGGPEPDTLHLSGVILRLNDDGAAPDDNPFFKAGARMGTGVGANLQKVFAYGLRNSFGMAFDPKSGDLWEQENGDDSFDEINRVEPGFNGGWIQVIGPIERIAEYKSIELSLPPSGGLPGAELQQLRWPPTLIADTPGEARSRLFRLPGSRYSDPEFSWKFALAPAGIGFLNSSALGQQFEGNLFLGASTPALAGGYLFRFELTANRKNLALSDHRLGDRVADNLGKFSIVESETLLFGTNFGVVTDIHTGPNGNLFIVSLSNGAVYEIRRR